MSNTRTNCISLAWWALLFICIAYLCQATSAAPSPALDQRAVVTRTMIPVTTTAQVPTPALARCQAPCECMVPAMAQERWGPAGYVQCNESPCGYSSSVTGAPATQYCFRQKTAAPASPTAPVRTVPVVSTTLSVQTTPVQTIPLQTTAPAVPVVMTTVKYTTVAPPVVYTAIPLETTPSVTIKEPGEVGPAADLIEGVYKNPVLKQKGIVKGPVSIAPGFLSDDDKDGVVNYLDECPGTPAGVMVYENGCRCKDKGLNMYNKTSAVALVGNDKVNVEIKTLYNSCEGTSTLHQVSCNPDFESGASNEPFLTKKIECTWGCYNKHCRRPDVCSTYDKTSPDKSQTCADGIQNQDETGVDCGGKCPPCNTKCSTGTKYAPSDTPCTSVYNYQSNFPSVPGSNYPADSHWIDPQWDANAYGCSLCYYPCRVNEVCHPALDPFIQEAVKCCSLTEESAIDGQMPEPDLCKYATKNSDGDCKKCTGLYIIKELSEGTRWMHEHIIGNSATDPNHCWDLNKDGKINNDTECQAGEVRSPPWNAITAKGGTPPDGTANYLLNYYHTGICHDYITALTTLLRKAGYYQEDVGGYCDGAHCYNVVRFPGDIAWHVVDADTVQDSHANAFELGKVQTGYPYCHTLDETSIFNNMGSYYTGPIPDINAYWNAVKNGQTYSYPHKQPFQPQCKGPYDALPCSMVYGSKPGSGPGVAGSGKDNVHLPDFGVPVGQLVGC